MLSYALCQALLILIRARSKPQIVLAQTRSRWEQHDLGYATHLYNHLPFCTDPLRPQYPKPTLAEFEHF